MVCGERISANTKVDLFMTTIVPLGERFGVPSFDTVATGDAGLLEVQWLYWAAPIIGGIIAGVIMNYVYVNKAEKEA